MEINAKEILERHRKKDDRKRQSLYLSQSLYDNFRKACGEVPASQVMEDLMQAFIESAKGKR